MENRMWERSLGVLCVKRVLKLKLFFFLYSTSASTKCIFKRGATGACGGSRGFDFCIGRTTRFTITIHKLQQLSK